MLKEPTDAKGKTQTLPLLSSVLLGGAAHSCQKRLFPLMLHSALTPGSVTVSLLLMLKPTGVFQVSTQYVFVYKNQTKGGFRGSSKSHKA